MHEPATATRMVEIAGLGERLSALRLCDAEALTTIRPPPRHHRARPRAAHGRDRGAGRAALRFAPVRRRGAHDDTPLARAARAARRADAVRRAWRARNYRWLQAPACGARAGMGDAARAHR